MNSLDKCFPDRTLLYLPGPYQGLLLPILYLQSLKNNLCPSTENIKNGNYGKHENVGSEHSCDTT